MRPPTPLPTLKKYTHVPTDFSLLASDGSWLVTCHHRFYSRSSQFGVIARAPTQCRYFTSDRCITLHGTTHRCGFCLAARICRGEYVGSREAST